MPQFDMGLFTYVPISKIAKMFTLAHIASGQIQTPGCIKINDINIILWIIMLLFLKSTVLYVFHFKRNRCFFKSSKISFFLTHHVSNVGALHICTYTIGTKKTMR
jgi:hypothetical protein